MRALKYTTHTSNLDHKLTKVYNLCINYTHISRASSPGPAQLSVACSTVKQGEPGIFSHVSMM